MEEADCSVLEVDVSPAADETVLLAILGRLAGGGMRRAATAFPRVCMPTGAVRTGRKGHMVTRQPANQTWKTISRSPTDLCCGSMDFPLNWLLMLIDKNLFEAAAFCCDWLGFMLLPSCLSLEIT